MARLRALPSTSIISGFKGLIDYYVYMGIPCARAWPRYSKRQPTLNEALQQLSFSYIVSSISQLPPDLVNIYKVQAQGTPWTWRDYCVKSYIEGMIIS